MGLLDTIAEFFAQGTDEEPPEDDSMADDAMDEALDDGSSEPESDTPESDTEQRLTELQTQVKNLESQASQAENKARALEKQLDDMGEELENIDNRTFKLLGIYDALVARINPLVRGSFDDIPSITDKHARDIPDDTLLSQYEDETAVDPTPAANPDDTAPDTNEDDTSQDEPRWEVDPSLSLSPADAEAELHAAEADEDDHSVEAAAHGHLYQTPEMDTFPLDALNTDIQTEELLSEWVLMLLHQGGLDGFFSSLQHYVSLGWLHEDIAAEIEDRANKSMASQLDIEFTPHELEGPVVYNDSRFDGVDHERSYAYITLLNNYV